MFRLINKFLHKFSEFIQQVIIVISLVLVYSLGFGVTLIFVAIFKPKILRRDFKRKKSSWTNAEGYEPTLDDCLRQS